MVMLVRCYVGAATREIRIALLEADVPVQRGSSKLLAPKGTTGLAPWSFIIYFAF
jgi:hypothetical protein